MAWIRLTDQAMYLMEGGEDCYIDKIELQPNTDSSTSLNIPLEWFRDGNSPRTMVVDRTQTEPSACAILSASPKTSLGIDVSGHEGTVDWDAVKNAGVSFAFIKATEGRTFVDDTFARNWSEMKRVGILRGAYHFFLPDRSADEQAKNFLETVKFGSGDLFPVLDIEVSRGINASAIIKEMKRWLELVESAVSHKPIIYTFPNFWSETLGNPVGFSQYPLWIAHFTTAPRPIVPGDWNNHTFWQYTESGTVRGVRTPVDRNRFNGSPTELVNFTI
jgi:GH25 family lysozyme M1 (1,4-beta-N-acetylmuramidase)